MRIGKSPPARGGLTLRQGMILATLVLSMAAAAGAQTITLKAARNAAQPANDLDLSWEAPGVSSFQIDRCSQGGSRDCQTWNSLGIQTATTLTDFGAMCVADFYYYSVREAATAAPTADGGPDQADIACGYANRIQLGGNPSASGGAPPYTYLWEPSLGLVDDPGPEWDKENPWLIPVDNVEYTLTVTDSTPADSDPATVQVTVDKNLNHCGGVFDRTIGSCGEDFSIPGLQWNDATQQYEDITFNMHENRCKVIMIEIGDLW